MKNILIAVMFLFGITASAQFFEPTKQLDTFDGFFRFHYDEKEGSLFLEVSDNQINNEFLYVHSLRSGLGSNDIGLDRGQLGSGDVVKFQRSGNKLLLVQPNLKYRAVTDNGPERKSVEEAFTRSVLFGFEIKKTHENIHLIDLTPFLMQDAHNIIGTLKKEKQGTYKYDASRSALWMERTKAFPKNVEFEAMLTFTGDPERSELTSVAPNAQSVSTIQHHSFVALPEPGYTPRSFDPRSGSYPMSYLDYASPVYEPIKKQWITRHRLEKLSPEADISEAKEPIIYYLDPGTPEPIRSALLDGARWWNQAFEAIGYRDAFQVKMLPEDADPLDVRYNVIQWVHRSTRGWSYGSTITDPRTGEIIKGHVSLGSLRIRQDFMIAQAMMNAPFKEGDSNHNPMMQLALSRIRQLSAHEVGHTIGFSHNFAASTNQNASVMDYPHPSFSLMNGKVNINNAYASGIGDWDKVSVAYSYSEIPSGMDETGYLKEILDRAFNSGLRYISDSDARARGGAHALAHLWDNGADAAEELIRLLEVRKAAIQDFSEDNIRTGEPFSTLEDVFVPLYFLHRFQTEAAVKSVGGMDYDYQLKGYAGKSANYLPKETQVSALAAVLKTLQVETLMIPKKQLRLFPPRAFGYPRGRESFQSELGVAFDAMGAAATASDMSFGLLLHVERANRLIQQKGLQPNNLGLEEVLERLFDTLFDVETSNSYEEEIAHMIQYRALQYLFSLTMNPHALPQVKGMCRTTIQEFAKELKGDRSAFAEQLLFEIDKFEEDPEEYQGVEAPKIPDGSPIGSFQCGIWNE